MPSVCRRLSRMSQTDGILSQPLLYLSLYFKQHRAEYYRLLDEVRLEGDWEAWVDFFACSAPYASTLWSRSIK